MAGKNEYILELLTEYGLVDENQLAEARRKVDESKGNLDIIGALKRLGYIDDEALTELLAQQYGLESMNLENYSIPDEVIDMMTAEQVAQYNVVPVMKHDDVLTIAMSNPTDMDTVDSLRYLLGLDIEAVVASEEHINKIIAQHYATAEETVDSFIEDIVEGDIEGQLTEGGSIGTGENLEEDDAPIVKLVSLIIIDAFKMKASDIHLEPLEKRYRIRYRVDGVLREVEAPPKYLQANLTSRLKIMAQMDISEKRIPLDGRIQLRIGKSDIDLRVNSIPTTHGESIVMRILDKSSIQLDIPKLGFFTDDLEKVEKVLAMPDGAFLVTGPTGSGKTTSLYAFLNTINTPNRKIITVEHPVEYQLSGINQVQVNPVIGLTFAVALRAILRQAPNIIMVGETRDLETAEIMINASLTGHLVFTTLHTNDAPSAVTRLVDIGIKPFLVATAVKAIMAQRLLRRTCKNCIAPYVPSEHETRLLAMTEEEVETMKFVKGTGCEACGGSGYKGRVGIYEIFTVDEHIKPLIFANRPSNEIRDLARKHGMKTLRDDGLRKAANHTSTIEEVIRITVADEE